MPPWFNQWLLGAIMLSMSLHFMILEVDFLSVRPASCLRVLYTTEVPTNRQLIAIPGQLRKLELNVKFFSRHMAHGPTLISVSIALSQTPAYTASDSGLVLVYRAACLFTPQLLPVPTAPIHGGMARLSWPGWLVKHQDGADANFFL